MSSTTATAATPMMMPIQLTPSQVVRRLSSNTSSNNSNSNSNSNNNSYHVSVAAPRGGRGGGRGGRGIDGVGRRRPRGGRGQGQGQDHSEQQQQLPLAPSTQNSAAYDNTTTIITDTGNLGENAGRGRGGGGGRGVRKRRINPNHQPNNSNHNKNSNPSSTSSSSSQPAVMTNAALTEPSTEPVLSATVASSATASKPHSASSTRQRPQQSKKKNHRQQQQQRQQRDPSNEDEEVDANAAPMEATNSNENVDDAVDAAPNALEPGMDNVRPNRNQHNNNNNNNRSTKNKRGKNPPKSDLKQQSNSNNNNNSSVKWAWKKQVPKGAVDPITLDPLRSLRYPPFALVATPPYDPVPVWPIESANDDQHAEQLLLQQQQEQEEERQRQLRILQEQWGDRLALVTQQQQQLQSSSYSSDMEGTDRDRKPSAKETNTEPPYGGSNKRHYHLYDGRALAYYMVSQLQFIDPLNRRDCTRDELVTLDTYLRRHGFADHAVVTEAYDAKGITISTAGAAGHTAAGRAAMLQQEARILLEALFGGMSVMHRRGTSAAAIAVDSTAVEEPAITWQPSRPHRSTSTLMQQYQAHQTLEQQQQQYRCYEQQSSWNSNVDNNGISGGDNDGADTGIYGDTTTGLIVVDDDLHPGLRGNAMEFVPVAQRRSGDIGVGGGLPSTATPPSMNLTMWSANRISQRYGGNRAGPGVGDFPALSEAISTTDRQEQPQLEHDKESQKRLPVSKTLAQIGKAVKKTDPEEVQRQFEAREAARRKAILSNLTFGSNPAAWDVSMGTEMMQPFFASNDVAPSIATAPTQGQLERNRAMADALGIKTATERQQRINAGWARPFDSQAELDEFGNELNTTIYPDAMIRQARERMGPLLKLEKKWKTFLSDDTAASLPLNHMEKGLRAFVHEYSDYWRLHTESFDPEPKRYIHCVKLLDTRAPYPLLSEAAHNWRGPAAAASAVSLATQQQRRQQHQQQLASNYYPPSEHPSHQSAGQTTWGRELPAAPERVPLPLRSLPLSTLPSRGGRVRSMSPSFPPQRLGGGGTTTVVSSSMAALSMNGAPRRTMTTETDMDNNNGRFRALDRERPKLELAKRTLPLSDGAQQQHQQQGPPLQGLYSEDIQRQKDQARKRAQRARDAAARAERALQAAFASDDEGDDNSNNDDDSDWGVEEKPLYSGSDDEA